MSSTGNDPAPDPDDDVNGDDNGRPVGALIASQPVTLTGGGEPTSEDGDANTNLTVDFGFIAAARPRRRRATTTATRPTSRPAPPTGDYNTTALDNGAFHLLGVANAPCLGACVDADSGFNQNLAATGDDLATSTPRRHLRRRGRRRGRRDLHRAVHARLARRASRSRPAAAPPAPRRLGGLEPRRRLRRLAGEQIATTSTCRTGAPTVLTPAVPAGAVPGVTYARFRCSSAGGLEPTGPAADGEVEDYALGVVGNDFGDAPASYGTQGAGAASHTIDPLAPAHSSAPAWTPRPTASPTPAPGDDNTAGTSRVGNCFDDEDGVTFTSVPTACQTAQVDRHRRAPPASSTPGSTSTATATSATPASRSSPARPWWPATIP